jgi:cell division protein FtsB
MPTTSPPRLPRPSAPASPSRTRQAAGVVSGPLAAQGRIRWDRVGRIALLALLAVVLLLYIAPLRNWLAQSVAANRQQNELRALEREDDRLSTDARELRRDAAIEREARRLGMIKRGERAYVIQRTGR